MRLSPFYKLLHDWETGDISADLVTRAVCVICEQLLSGPLSLLASLTIDMLLVNVQAAPKMSADAAAKITKYYSKMVNSVTSRDFLKYLVTMRSRHLHT